MAHAAHATNLRQAYALLTASSSEAERRAANEWLVGFAKTAEAWGAAEELVRPSEAAEEVAFFAANLLYSKIKTEWHTLADAPRRQLRDALWSAACGRPSGGEGQPGPAARRLCLALAAAAARTEGLAEESTRLALSLAAAADAVQGGLAVELLGALANEVVAEEEATGAASPGRSGLRALAPAVLCALQALAPLSSSMCIGCLRALQAWLALNAGSSLASLYAGQGPLLAATLNALAAVNNEPLNLAAADALGELLTSTNSPLPASAPRGARDAAEAVAAQFGVLAREVRLAELLMSGEPADDRLFYFCRALCAFAERCVDLVAVTEGSLLPLVELLLLCAGGELRVAELSIDFWVGLQDTAVAQRHERLRAPLYRRLATLLLDKCTLPAEFTSWDEAAEDEEEFRRFREQSALEVLGACLSLLACEFVGQLQAMLQGSPPWQKLEAALFVLRGLHVQIKGALRGSAADGEGRPSAAAELQAALNQLLGFVFGQLAAWRPSGATLLVESAMRLVGAFAKWLQRDEALLRGCLRLVLEAVQAGGAPEHAAEAFRALCIHGRRRLASAAYLSELVGPCTALAGSAALASSVRLTLQEALARLVGAAPSPAEAEQLLHALVRAPCEQLAALLPHLPPSDGASVPPETAPRASDGSDGSRGSGGEAAATAASTQGVEEAVATQLALIGAAIRFSDTIQVGGGGSCAAHPVFAVLSYCWPLLQDASRRGGPSVLQALLELHGRAMGCLGGGLAPLLPSILEQIGTTFCRRPVVGALECLTQAIELYGESHEAPLSDTLEKFVDAVCGWLASTAAPEAEPELLSAFFELCHRCLVFRPQLLLSLPCVASLFDAAAACVAHQEFQHTRAAITFLCLFLSGTDAANLYRESAAHCLQRSGGTLLRYCVQGLASASPANLVDHQIELLRVIAESAPTAVHGWLVAALADPGLDLGALPRQGAAAEAFVRGAAQQHATVAAFHCVASEFSRVCRGKAR